MSGGAPHHEAIVNTAEALLAENLHNGAGRVSAAVYDTACLVAAVPWLTGHDARLEFLCRQQGPHGAWGEADGYAMVPTLSATDALLATLAGPGTGTVSDRSRLTVTARRGLDVLREWLRPGNRTTTPDMIAIEFLVPALVESINDRLATLAAPDSPCPHPAWDGPPLALPWGFDAAPLAAVRSRLRQASDDTALSRKLWASLEAFGPAVAAFASRITPTDGAVGASPAATAAWLAHQAHPDPAAVSYLDRLQAEYGGPVAGVSPITFFERAWLLNSFADGGIPHVAPTAMLDDLDAALGEFGVPAAPGLPADADDAAAVLCALARNGRVRAPDCLLHYQADGYFRCFIGERTPSVSTNAHILQALACYTALRPDDAIRFDASLHMVADWVLGSQQADGEWYDKWHASPYYATVGCVVALTEARNVIHSGHIVAAIPATLARAADWLLATQRADGSWGRWRGTIEETAYAVQALTTAATPDRGDAIAAAVAAGCTFLEDNDDPATYPGLWHAKDLYAPVNVIRGARAASLMLGARYTLSRQPVPACH